MKEGQKGKEGKISDRKLKIRVKGKAQKRRNETGKDQEGKDQRGSLKV